MWCPSQCSGLCYTRVAVWREENSPTTIVSTIKLEVQDPHYDKVNLIT